MSNPLQPHGLYSPWNSLGQNTEVGSLILLQGIFSIQGSNPGLPHCRQIVYHLSHQESLVHRRSKIKVDKTEGREGRKTGNLRLLNRLQVGVEGRLHPRKKAKAAVKIFGTHMQNRVLSHLPQTSLLRYRAGWQDGAGHQDISRDV